MEKDDLLNIACNGVYLKDPNLSAKVTFKYPLLAIIILFILPISCAIIWLDDTINILLWGFNCLFLATLGLKILLFIVGLFTRPSIKLYQGDDVPIYSVLIPLYKERAVILKQIVRSMTAMDYPKDKLDVKIVIEADDDFTSNNIPSDLPSFIEVIRVPYAEPRTKPKACNYALHFVRGEYVTIYDAEDIPDPQQLRKALAVMDKNTGCVQSQLTFYNWKDNFITRMFRLEYDCLFKYFLPALDAMNLPIPLGGTSNHFNTSNLKELGAWDAYNVTEDADLGVRISTKGQKIRIIESKTDEECPKRLKPWLMQRSRWIKGFMQTALVHMRKPFSLLRKIGLKEFLGLLFFVATPPIIFVITPIAIMISIYVIASDYALSDALWHICVWNFVLGVIFHILAAMIISVKEKLYSNILWSLAYPFYWLIHSIAGYIALWELFTAPHKWQKTDHGHSIS